VWTLGKFTRTFNGAADTTSESTRGPLALIADLDALGNLLDPLAVGGGIDTENLNDDIVTDAILGDRTIDASIATAFSNTGTLTQIISWLGKQVRLIIGGASWFSAPPESLTGLNTRLTTAEGTLATDVAALATHKTSTDHDSRYYTETEIDAKVSMTNGAIASLDGVKNAGGDIDLVGGTGITITPNDGANTITITATGIALPAPHASEHASTGVDAITPASIGASADTHNHDSAYAPIGAATTATYEATVTTTWTGTSAPFSQKITVTGIISGEVCTVDIDLTDAEDYEEEQAIATDWAKIYRIVASDDDEITVYATAETTIAMPVTIKAVR